MISSRIIISILLFAISQQALAQSFDGGHAGNNPLLNCHIDPITHLFVDKSGKPCLPLTPTSSPRRGEPPVVIGGGKGGNGTAMVPFYALSHAKSRTLDQTVLDYSTVQTQTTLAGQLNLQLSPGQLQSLRAAAKRDALGAKGN